MGDGKRKSRFVTSDIVRLPLSDGDWIEVKGRLSYGESLRLSSSMLRTVKGTGGDNEVGIDFARHALGRMQAYLVDWSFRDADDKPVALSPSAIENLDEGTAREIDEALTAHIEAHGAPKAAPTN